MFKPTLCAALALTALSLAPLAHAARPFLTDDAGVLEAKSCELEPVLMQARTDYRFAPFQGSFRSRGQLIQGACGVGYSTQLGLGFSRTQSEGSSSRETQLSGKTSLIDGGEERPSLTLGYSALFAPRDGGGSQRYDSANLGLIATVPLGKLGFVHGNAVYVMTQSPPGQKSTTWALAWEVPVVEGFDVGVERYSNDRSDDPWWGLGVRWTASKAVSVNASIHKASSQAVKARLTTLGLRFAF